jgi:hypothetical protein
MRRLMLILMRAGFGGQHVTKECTIIQCERLSRTRNLQSAIRKHKHKRVPQNSQMGISRTAQLKKKKSLSFFVCVVQTTTMSSSKKKDRKQRHTVNLARSSGSNVTSPESKSERQKFLARLSVALPSDAAADDDDNNDERREIEHLFSQLPPLDSPKRSARGATSPRNNDDDPDARDERRRHGEALTIANTAHNARCLRRVRRPPRPPVRRAIAIVRGDAAIRLAARQFLRRRRRVCRRSRSSVCRFRPWWCTCSSWTGPRSATRSSRCSSSARRRIVRASSTSCIVVVRHTL